MNVDFTTEELRIIKSALDSHALYYERKLTTYGIEETTKMKFTEKINECDTLINKIELYLKERKGG